MRHWLSSITIAGALLLLPALALAATGDGCVPSTADKFAGLFTLSNLLWIAGGIGGAACLSIIVVQLWEIIEEIPTIVWEVIGYGLCAVSIYYGSTQTGGLQSGLLLLGSISFAGMLVFTGKARKLPENYTRYFLTLFVVWSGIAWVFQDEYVGFIAVIALMGTLGFSAGVIPGLGYWMGFKDEEALGRATAAAFVILALFVLDHILKPPSSLHIHVFESGALWMGSFVGFLGLLILSWGRGRGTYPWPVRQLLVCVFCSAAVAIGLVYDVPYMAKIGGTFFGLYLVEKPFDLAPKELLPMATVGLAVFGTMWFAAGWIERHHDLFGPYLLF